MSFTRSVAYPWALTGIFGAFHMVMTFIPYSVLGTGGGALTWGMVSAPIVGFLLGPFYGTLAVLIGSFIGTGIMNLGGDLGVFIPILAPTAGALTAGTLRVKRPQIPILIYAILIIIYLLSPIGINAILYLWLHIVALILTFIFLIPKISETLVEGMALNEEINPVLSIVGIWMLCFIALLADHLLGSAFYAWWGPYVLGWEVGWLTDFYVGFAFVYPIERIIASIIVGFVVIAVGETLAKTYFELPTMPGVSRELEELSHEEIKAEEEPVTGIDFE
jgi:hypothetical protein